MTKYSAGFIPIVLVFALAFYGAQADWWADAWIVAVLTAALLYVAYGLARVLSTAE